MVALCYGIWQDGRIDYGEFATMMRKGDAEIGSRTIRGNLNFSLADAFAGKTDLADQH